MHGIAAGIAGLHHMESVCAGNNLSLGSEAYSILFII